MPELTRTVFVGPARGTSMAAAPSAGTDLAQISTVVWAKVTGHPFWPARLCRSEEQERHVRFRQRKNDMLVYFFAAGNTGSYGWVIPTNVKPFDPTKGDENTKVKNKSLRAAVSAAMDFCERIARGDGFDSLSRCKLTLALISCWPSFVCPVLATDRFD